ncbi:MAG: oligosaccharide flippase family protein [Clostridia bacterium]|nr:oligosaccharide flippase family protein [Clostridia bacterium]
MQPSKASLRRPVAASVSYTVTAAVGKAAALLTLPFFTARLGAAAYGRYALYLCYEGILFSVLSVGLGGAAIYRALQQYRGEENRLLASAFGLSLLVLLLCLPIALPLLIKRLAPDLCAVLFLQVLANVSFTLYGAKCRYTYRYRPICLLNLCAELLSPLLSMLVLLSLPIGERARIYVGAAVSVALGAFSLFALLKHRTRLFDKEMLRFLLSLQLPLLPHYLSLSLMAEAARLSVERVLGSEALGAYAVAHSVGLCLSLVTASLGGAFQPWVLRKSAAGEHARVSDATERITLLLLTVSLLPILAAPEIFSVLAPRDYLGGAAAVPALCFTVPLSFLSTAPILAKLGAGRRAAISLPSLFAALSQLAICPYLAARLGLFGAALGALISYFLFFLLHAATLKKEQKRIINANKCFLFCFLFAAVGLAVPILYPHAALRLLLFILYLPAALLELLSLKSILLESASKARA